MSNFGSWPNQSAKKLNVGGDFLGGRGMEYLLMGALALIIVGSLVMTIVYGFGGGNTGSDTKPMYHCNECGEDFELKRDSIPEEEMMMTPEMGIYRPDCPKCGEKNSAVPMVRCPECEKYFVSPRLEFEEEAMRSGRMVRPDEMPEEICPHCGTDRIQWYRDKRKKD